MFDQAVISRLDADFQVVDSFIGFPAGRAIRSGIDITETTDNGYLLTWKKDVT